jgi:flagellin
LLELDERRRLQTFMMEKCSSLKYPTFDPSVETVFEYFVNDNGDWMHWRERVPQYLYPVDSVPEFSSIIIPTVDNVRSEFLIDTIARQVKSELLIVEPITANTFTIKVGGAAAIDLGPLAAASSNSERMGQIVQAINAKTADTGVTAFFEKDADGLYQLTVNSEKLDAAGAPEVVTIAGLAAVATGKECDGTTDVNMLANSDLDVTATAATDGKGIDTLSVKTQAEAWTALKKIDDAIDNVNSKRGDLGALQTRFEKTVENIDIQNENISAARGRIVDADFAAETANLSRSQILQQAGTAMVAQANQLPQNVLSLLR